MSTRLLLFLLSLPVIIVGGIAYMIVRRRRINRWRRDFARRTQSRAAASDVTPPVPETIDGRPPVSIVALLARPRVLEEEFLRQAVERAWDVSFPRDDADATEFVVAGGESAPGMIKTADCCFLLNTIPHPYLDPDALQAAEGLLEKRLRHALASHRAWISVDQIDAIPMPEDQAYRRIGWLLAELLDDDALALLHPATEQAVCWDSDSHLALLRGNDPLSVFEAHASPPVVPVDDDDPRMVAAVEQARRRWGEFAAAFEGRVDGQMFAVKGPFGQGEQVEFMWMRLQAIEGDAVRGLLDNEPVDVPGLHEGDSVTLALSDLNDWMYVDADGQMHGGFTVDVVGAEPDDQGNRM